MKVYERIRYLRQDRNMSQEDLGRLLGVTKATIQKYENGQIRNLKSEIVKRLCEIFAVAPVFFIFDDVPDYIDDRLNDMLIAHYEAWFEEFLENISSLTEEGKAKARTYVEDLASIDKYRIPEYKSIRREKEEPMRAPRN